MKKLFLAVCVLVIGFGQVANAATSDQAKAFVQGVSDQVIKVLQTGQSDAQKEQQLISIFEKSVDVEWMGRFALGRYTNTATPEQLKRYNELYRQYLIASYIPRFKSYTSEKINITQARGEGDEFTVQTEIVRPNNQQPIAVNYRVKEKKGQFVLVDVIGEGVSLITTQRSDFSGGISQGGMDQFLTKLEQKTQSLRSSGGQALPGTKKN